MNWNDFIKKGNEKSKSNGKAVSMPEKPNPVKETAQELATKKWQENMQKVSWVHPFLAITSSSGAKAVKDAVIINVADELNTPADIKLPVMPENGQDATMVRLDMLGEVIADHINNGEKVVVHCMAGIERSVLTVAWFLKNHLMFGTLDNAYAHIQRVRPIAERRDWWVEGDAPMHAPMVAAPHPSNFRNINKTR